MNGVKTEELALWKKWQKSRSSMDAEALLRSLAPILRRAVTPWVSVMPAYMLENEAKRLALKSFETYDPNHASGATVATHVSNALQKLSRFGYAHQASVTIPEQKRITFNTYNKVRSQLEDMHGRPPSHAEVADHMHLSAPKLKAIVDLVGKRELMESGDGPVFVQHMDDPEVVDLAFHDMTPVQKQIFEMRTGYNGAQVKGGQAIMAKLDIGQGALSYQLGQIKTLLTRAKDLR